MRSMAIVVAVSCSLSASAERPTAIELARKPSPILGGRLQITLLKAMTPEPAGALADGTISTRAVFDWGTARLVMIAYDICIGVGDDPRAAITADVKAQGDNVTRARIEPLAVSRPLVAFALWPPLPRRLGDPNLVFATYVVTANDTLQVLAFYIDDGGLSDAAAWAIVSRRIAATMTPGVVPEIVPRLVVALPDQWRRTSCVNAKVQREWITMPTRSACELRKADAHLDERGTSSISGMLLGSATNWRVWTDPDGFHAEIETGELDSQHLDVLCAARTQGDLDRLREVIETLHE